MSQERIVEKPILTTNIATQLMQNLLQNNPVKLAELLQKKSLEALMNFMLEGTRKALDLEKSMQESQCSKEEIQEAVNRALEVEESYFLQLLTGEKLKLAKFFNLFMPQMMS